MEPLLNRELLPENSCFGCGHENHAGLRIEIYRDANREDALHARFTPTASMGGFPGITHGGAIFTALDCLSTWVSTLLGPNRRAAWILRSATTTYHKPAPIGEPLTLTGWIKAQAGEWEPVIVRAEARRADETLCVEAEFKVVPLSRERLTEVAGLDQLPPNWAAFLSDAR